MEEFSAIKIEAYLSGAWVDLTPDVRMSPGPRVSSIGIMNTSIKDRVGDAGQFEFTLDNSASNSALTLGYYTPEGDNVRSGWTQGVAVRMYFEYAGWRKYGFYGHIDGDGIKVVTGRYGTREVNVKASNWMADAAKHKMNLVQRELSQRIDQSVERIVANMDRKPLKVLYRIGDQTFPTIFDTMRSNTRPLAEFEKLALSELGRIFVTTDQDGGELLVVENRDYRQVDAIANSNGSPLPTISSALTDELLMEGGAGTLLLENGAGSILLDSMQRASFTDSDFEELQISYGKNMYNRIKFSTYPRDYDASTVVLWSLGEPIEIQAGEELTNIRGVYLDPNNSDAKINGFDFVVPVATTDYIMYSNETGSGGVDRTADLVVTAKYGAAEVEYTLTNNNAAVSYITFLQARGKGIYIYDTVEKIYDSEDQQDTFGILPLDMNLHYLDSLDALFTWADKAPDDIFGGGILTGVDMPEMSIDNLSMIVNKSSKAMMAFMLLDPGLGYLRITEQVSDPGSGGNNYWSRAHWIQGHDFEVIDGKIVKWKPVLKIEGRY